MGTFGFTGELQDIASDLLYLRARWYDPESGTLTTRDPFGGAVLEPQSLHVYTYVQNHPINFIDPTGLYRCVDGTRAYQAFCQSQWEKMDGYLDIQNPESWIREDSLRALLFMFSDKLQSSDLPGGSGTIARKHRQENMSSAAERLEFVLWYTETSPGSPGHFRGDLRMW